MKTWKALPAALALFGAASLAHATPISLQDVTEFTASGTNSAEDYDDHGRYDVNKLDGFLDFVQWTHYFAFNPAVDSILSATLSLDLSDDGDRDICILGGCEFGGGVAEDGSWDFGEIDTGTYKYDVGVTSLMDGSFQVTVASVQGDFYINKSTLDIEYLPVPEPGTLALLGLGLSGLVLTRRRQKV